MVYYLLQWKYKDEAVKAMLEIPQDRPKELQKAVEAFGGKLHHFFYAFGPYDGIAITEFPDNASCAACVLMLTGAGANASFSTTVLLAPGEGYRAMQKAKETKSGYQAPAGYGSYG